MKRGMGGLIVAAVAGCAGLGIWTATAGREASAAAVSANGTRVAVVDLVRIFNEIKQTRAVNQKMDEHKNLLGQERDRRQQEISGLKKALDAINPDTADWYKRNEELKKKRFEYEVWQAVELDNIGNRHHAWVKRIYNTITEEVARVARQHGFQLVVTREEIETPSTTDPSKLMQAMLQQIMNRKVVYADPAIDLTDEVIRNLDAAFEKAGGIKSLDPMK